MFRARGIVKTDNLQKLWPGCNSIAARLAFYDSNGVEHNYALIMDAVAAQRFAGHYVEVEGEPHPLPCTDHSGKPVTAIRVKAIHVLGGQQISGTIKADDGSIGTVLLIILLAIAAVYLLNSGNWSFSTFFESYNGKPCYECALQETKNITAVTYGEFTDCGITGYHEFDSLAQLDSYVKSHGYLAYRPLSTAAQEFTPPFHMFEISCSFSSVSVNGVQETTRKVAVAFDSECDVVYGTPLLATQCK